MRLKLPLGIVLVIVFCSWVGISQSLSKGPSTAGSPPPQVQESVVRDSIFKKDGQWYRVVEYSSGKTNTMLLPPPVGERTPINVDTINKDSIVVVVEKELNVLYILYKRKRIRQYRAVFGPDKSRDKYQEGDRCTPEGWFKIVKIRDHKEWQKFMLLDYPTPESYEKFYTRKKNGEISENARIGGNIGIHGTFKGGDNMVEMGLGWTDGCVALKSSDIYDLAKFVKEGTRVYITKRSKAVIRNSSSRS